MISTILIVTFLQLFSVVTGACPNGFIRHGNSCYHVIRNRATWAEASTYCRAFGSRLVSIETQDENDFLVHRFKLIQKTNEELLKTMESLSRSELCEFNPPKFWIGGNDIAETGTWVWEKTDTKIADGYHDWNNGNPDNGGDDADEHCLEIQADHGWKWNDNECRETFYPVCEVESAPLISGSIIIG